MTQRPGNFAQRPDNRVRSRMDVLSTANLNAEQGTDGSGTFAAVPESRAKPEVVPGKKSAWGKVHQNALVTSMGVK